MNKMRKPTGNPRGWQVVYTKEGAKLVERPVRIYGPKSKPRPSGSPAPKSR
jgi:hypothetical protein